MTEDQGQRGRVRALRRIAKIRARLSALDYVCSGTLLRRMKRCGKAACRCAKDLDQLHGPYFEWSRRDGGRLVHTLLSEEQATAIEAAIANLREILGLLRTWEHESAHAIGVPERRK